MPLRTNFVERILINNGIIPGPLLDVGISMFQMSAVLTAGDIRLFNHLKNASLTLKELSEKTGCSEKGLSTLLSCLINLGYVKQNGHNFALTKAMQRSFPIDDFPDMIPFFRKQAEIQIQSSSIAVKDNPSGGIIGWDIVKSGEIGKSYQVSMRWLASGTVDEVVSKTKFKTHPKRMLDIGGSHGLYCVRFCRKYPELKATNLDWAIGIDNAKITMAQEKDISSRIDLFEADFMKDNLPTDYDFVFLGNIIHGLAEEENLQLFTKISASATSNSTIAILDQYSNIKGSAFVKGVASLIGWNLFLFAGGQAYGFDEVKRWLENAGFHSVNVTNLKRSPGFSLITAQKKN
jgi:hypothetical protein